jgi:hypothetical protein
VVDLVLDEEVDQRHQGREEGASEYLSEPDSGGVLWAQSKTAQGPGKCGYEVRDHEDVVPVVGVGRGYVCPSTTRQRAEDANSSNEFGESGVRFTRQDVP